MRPANLPEGSPGNGYGIFETKNKKYKVAVINLMGNIYMRKSENVFTKAKKINKSLIKKMLILQLLIFMER